MDLKKEQLSTGYIKLYRSVKNNWLWDKGKKKSQLEAWIYLLFAASFTDQKELVGVDLIKIKRGDVLTSQDKLSKEWKWSRGAVARFLKLLENDGMILLKTNTKYTQITICNYATYNEQRTTNGHQTDIKRTSNGHIEECIKNGKELKDNDGDFFSQLLGDQMFFEKIAIAWRIDLSIFEKMIKAFEANLAAKSKIHPNYSEYKTHFHNWGVGRYSEFIPVTGRKNANSFV